MMSHTFATKGTRLLASLLLLLALSSFSRAVENWQVPEAFLRYELKLLKPPSAPSAGFLVRLPDGGILRKKVPFTVVMTPEGKELPSFLLWENSESGFSMVFAKPDASVETVYVYIRSDRPPQFWTPESGLTPSAVLCSSPGRDSMEAARNLAKMGHVDAAASVINKAGIPRAPLSIGGDETGRPRPGVFYMLCHVETYTAGKHWIAPMTQDGATEVYIDGKILNPTKRNDKWGGKGALYDLSDGVHRVEVFQTAPGSGIYTTEQNNRSGLMFMTWRTPSDKSDDKNETRIIRKSEVVSSGDCELQGAQSKDGSPVACPSLVPRLTYWFEKEEPLVLYDCRALGTSDPADTVYTWSFTDRGVAQTKDLKWVLPGFKEAKITLTAKSGNRVSESTVPVFAYGTESSSIDEAEHRAAYREAITQMLAAYPSANDPVANWSDSYWNNLIRTMEMGEGFPLLRQLFTQHWVAARRKLSPQQMNMLQDILIAIQVRENPAEALQWIAKFHDAAPDYPRRADLKVQEAEVRMFLLKDLNGARQILATMEAANDQFSEKAKVRLGDLALVEGDLNKATSYYADVQNRARYRRNAGKAATGSLVTQQLLEAGANSPLGSVGKGAPVVFGKANAAKERSVALQEVSFSENVKTLIQQGYLLEARQTLQTWESEFPLSKINGDFILAEAEFYMKDKNWKRARPMLEAYCRQIDASSFLPEVAGMLITCVKESNEPRESIREVIEKVKARLKYHPVAKDLEAFLTGS